MSSELGRADPDLPPKLPKLIIFPCFQKKSRGVDMGYRIWIRVCVQASGGLSLILAAKALGHDPVVPQKCPRFSTRQMDSLAVYRQQRRTKGRSLQGKALRAADSAKRCRIVHPPAGLVNGKRGNGKRGKREKRRHAGVSLSRDAANLRPS